MLQRGFTVGEDLFVTRGVETTAGSKILAGLASFGLVSLGVIGLIVGYHGRSERSLYLSVALGFLLGGAVGNVLDRLRLGYVVDFVDIGIGSLRWYIFNVADAAISAAIVMLVLVAILPGVARFVDARTDG